MNINQQLCPTEISSSNDKVSKQGSANKRNKTIKKRRRERKHQENNKKYNMKQLMASMNDNDDSDDESGLSDYKPLLPPPTLQQNTKLEPQPQYNPNTQTDDDSINNDNNDNKDTFVSNNGYMILNPDQHNMTNNNYVPYYTNSGNTQSLDGPKDALLEKLNYMIHLLEEQKEEKTGHVTEELILYSFLGVFVIFVVDSFARVGKYVR